MKWLWIESNGGYFVNTATTIRIFLTGWKWSFTCTEIGQEIILHKERKQNTHQRAEHCWRLPPSPVMNSSDTKGRGANMTFLVRWVLHSTGNYRTADSHTAHLSVVSSGTLLVFCGSSALLSPLWVCHFVTTVDPVYAGHVWFQSNLGSSRRGSAYKKNC